MNSHDTIKKIKTYYEKLKNTKLLVNLKQIKVGDIITTRDGKNLRVKDVTIKEERSYPYTLTLINIIENKEVTFYSYTEKGSFRMYFESEKDIVKLRKSK